MLEQQLQILGFGKNEIKIYLALFELGKSKAAIIIEKTKLHRNIVYQDLENLLKRGLISKTIVGGVAEYEANDPDFLVEEFEQKVNLAKQASEKLFSLAKEKPKNIGVYEGVEGIKRLRSRASDNIKQGEIFYVFGATDYSSHPGLIDFWRGFNLKIKNKGATTNLLFNSQENTIDFLEKRGFVWGENAKSLPFNTQVPMWAAFYDDVLDLTVGKKDFVTFSIKSKDAVEGFKAFFDYFWNQQVVVEEGFEAINKTWYGMLNELNAGEEYYVLGTSIASGNSELEHFFDEYHRKRIKKGVIVKMLAFSGYYDRMIDRLKRVGDAQFKISHIKKYISSPAVPMQITLYKNKADIIVFGDRPVVIHLNTPGVYEGFKTHFDNEWNQKTETLQTMKGVEYLCDRVISEKKDLYFIAANGQHIRNHPEHFKKFNSQRIEKGIKIKALVIEESRGMEITKLLNSEIKFLPKEFASPMVVWIFGDYVANVLWHEPETIFLTHDKKTAEYYRNYYKALEKTAKK